MDLAISGFALVMRDIVTDVVRAELLPIKMDIAELKADVAQLKVDVQKLTVPSRRNCTFTRNAGGFKGTR
jgi:hypothetical protein